MKIWIKRIILPLIVLVMLLSGCNKIDKDYGKKPEEKNAAENTTQKENYNADSIILSSDTVMPNYFDISLFDEENYSEIYLNKKFKFDITYDGAELTVPTKIKTMKKAGFEISETSIYNIESVILPGKYVELLFVNENGKEISGLFYNSSKASIELNKCDIVKLSIEANYLVNNDERFGSFKVNGIKNGMSIDEVIQTLGTPSHFYATASDNYYLDYFILNKDKRNGITVYVDPVNDRITAIEFSNYD